MAAPLFLLVLLLLIPLTAYLAIKVANAPLKRSTVERFARRQRLSLTPANATHVVSALTVTHRWRRAGLIIGLAFGVLAALPSGRVDLNVVAGFLGWFVGAVIAQWRIGRLPQPGERRAASLEPRGLRTYLTSSTIAWCAVALVGVLAAGVAAGVRGALSWDDVAYLALVGVGLGLTVREVVNRPSGFVDPDVREAEDALRGHGLTVLAGSGIAALGPALSDFLVQTAYPEGPRLAVEPGWTALVVIGCLLVGLFVSTWSRSARALRSWA